MSLSKGFIGGLAILASTTLSLASPYPSPVFNPSTCARQSTAACPVPTAYDPCCAYLCAEAQVPFLVCSPEKETVLASCSQCPSSKPTPDSPSGATPPLTTTMTTSWAMPTGTSTITTTSTITSTLTRSTCSQRVVTEGPACPTPGAASDPCCKFVCQEAQVPFEICQASDDTGMYKTCEACPTAAP